ncbi:Uncharacterized protein APZ42_016331 [Daphnia magna]|uniref:Uncharacterized protein n=1 Tax=Daphnia magna TaxID=35525 RepID=A0A165AD25_9CRUS|nr:Uncharacterized protein APZ42_016331 [Daphnia magna]
MFIVDVADDSKLLTSPSGCPVGSTLHPMVKTVKLGTVIGSPLFSTSGKKNLMYAKFEIKNQPKLGK